VHRLDAIDYLQHGNPVQQKVYRLLADNRIIKLLQPYSPVVAGTIPIGVNIPSSDVDILCCWSDKDDFIRTVTCYFSKLEDFIIKDGLILDVPTVLCNFTIDAMPFEIFGQPVPVKQQAGYLHMIKEHEILEAKGAMFRHDVIALKEEGYKTEPAFAKLLYLPGDPYLSLLEYSIKEN
jgi:hypothetical protein